MWTKFFEGVRSLKEKHGDKIERIILFGSIARGEDNEHSDGCANNNQLRFVLKCRS